MKMVAGAKKKSPGIAGPELIRRQSNDRIGGAQTKSLARTLHKSIPGTEDSLPSRFNEEDPAFFPENGRRFGEVFPSE
ncbi:hypothetical protein CEXT_571571 [Caerostris extrusa]|uniref:Uncharacterized protein n=1 Tax=Caerostris extrusa TaxID=172846 RepID=A0AAV4WGH0_CAEEX|nr:hypothetical protein CEXT_571571 [Caerostris extrusa]